jgi:hypothetical protein
MPAFPGEGGDDAVVAADDEREVVDDVVDQHQGLALIISRILASPRHLAAIRCASQPHQGSIA